jgi:hypothetical protein
MKCWPGWASVASTMTWYIVTALRELGARAVARSSSVTRSSMLEGLAEAPGQLGSVASQRAGDRAVAALDDLVHEALEEDAWRASSTCWVARKYFCSSRGAASMNGDRLSATESSPWKNIA